MRSLVAELAATGAGLVALCLAGAGSPVAVVAATWSFGAVVLVARRITGGAGQDRTARLLLAVVPASWVSEGPAPTRLVWLATAVLGLAMAGETLTARLRPHPDVLQLPGAPPVAAGRQADTLTAAALAVLVLGAALALAGDGPGRGWLWLAVAVLVAALELAALGVVGQARRRRPARVAQVRAVLAEHAPRFAVYTGRPDGGPHQVQMWLPFLERLGEPYVLVTRAPSAQRALTALTSAPVFCAASWRDLDPVLVPSLRTAYYVNAASTNTNFVGYRELTHVYLGHGDSDKALSYHPSHAMYDQVFVAGPAAVERYAQHGVRMAAEAFVVVGRPQGEAVQPALSGAAARVRAVLYAPTWAGYNAESSHSSLARGPQIVQALVDRGLTVVFRPHPFSRERPGERPAVAAVDAVLARDADRSGRRHVLSEQAATTMTLAECMNASQAMVCDVSSVLVDHLASGKPSAVVAAGEPGDRAAFVAEHGAAAGSYVIRDNLANLQRALDDLLGADPLRAEREQARRRYLGGLTGPQAVQTFLAAARAASSRIAR